MNPELHMILARQRVAELQRDADRARLASELDARRRDSRDSNPIARLSARLACLIPRRAPTELRGATDPARTPVAHDPVLDVSPPSETFARGCSLS